MSCNNELIIQESVEMEFLKWPTSHFLSSSNWNCGYQNFNLSHPYGQHPIKTHLWYDIYQTFHMIHKLSPIIWNHNI
jgi:hypothetical protein